MRLQTLGKLSEVKRLERLGFARAGCTVNNRFCRSFECGYLLLRSRKRVIDELEPVVAKSGSCH